MTRIYDSRGLSPLPGNVRGRGRGVNTSTPGRASVSPNRGGQSARNPVLPNRSQPQDHAPVVVPGCPPPEDKATYRKHAEFAKTVENRINKARRAGSKDEVVAGCNRLLEDIDRAIDDLKELLFRPGDTETLLPWRNQVEEIIIPFYDYRLLIDIIGQDPSKYREHEILANTVDTKIREARAASSLEETQSQLQALLTEIDIAIADLKMRSEYQRMRGPCRLTGLQAHLQKVRGTLALEAMFSQMILDCNTILGDDTEAARPNETEAVNLRDPAQVIAETAKYGKAPQGQLQGNFERLPSFKHMVIRIRSDCTTIRNGVIEAGWKVVYEGIDVSRLESAAATVSRTADTFKARSRIRMQSLPFIRQS